MLRRLSIISLFVTAICALLGTGGAVASPNQVVGTELPWLAAPRAAAREWTHAIDEGDLMSACMLQPVGPDCSGMPTTAPPLRCRGGSSVSSHKGELRSPAEQVGAITEETRERGYVVLNGQKKGSKIRGVLGVELQGGSWKVTYLRQGGKTFVPASSVWQTETWRKLWYPPTCTGKGKSA
jgi:hypothetical protein